MFCIKEPCDGSCFPMLLPSVTIEAVLHRVNILIVRAHLVYSLVSLFLGVTVALGSPPYQMEESLQLDFGRTLIGRADNHRLWNACHFPGSRATPRNHEVGKSSESWRGPLIPRVWHVWRLLRQVTPHTNLEGSWPPVACRAPLPHQRSRGSARARTRLLVEQYEVCRSSTCRLSPDAFVPVSSLHNYITSAQQLPNDFTIKRRTRATLMAAWPAALLRNNDCKQSVCSMRQPPSKTCYRI